jgi:hypothetical protein
VENIFQLANMAIVLGFLRKHPLGAGSAVEAWKPGSRLEIKLARPVPMVVDHVILACSPAEHVAWIDHALGTTMEQWVVFDALRAGGTRVRTWAEFTGIMPVLAGRPVKDCIRDFITGWYAKFADACDRQVP